MYVYFSLCSSPFVVPPSSHTSSSGLTCNVCLVFSFLFGSSLRHRKLLLGWKKVMCVFQRCLHLYLYLSLEPHISISIGGQVARVNDPIKLKITRPKLRLRRWLKATRMAKKKRPQNLPDEHGSAQQKRVHIEYIECEVWTVNRFTWPHLACSWLLQVKFSNANCL